MENIIQKLERKLQKGTLTEKELNRAVKVVQNMKSISEEDRDVLLAKLNDMILDERLISDDELPHEDKRVNASNIQVGESEKHFKINKKKLEKAIAGVALAGVVIVGGSFLIKGCHTKKTSVSNNTGIVTEQDVNEITNKNKTLKPTLAFDAEDTDVLITNLEETAKDMLSKGIAMEDATLEDTIESLTNYYVWMNLNEMGPTYLSKLYQTDSTSYMEIFSDAMYWANAIRFDSMTSSKADNTALDMSKFIANKKDSELVSKFLDINARLHDAVSANNMESIHSIVNEYRELVEKNLLDHSSYTYGGGAMDLCFRLVYSGEQLIQDYDVVIMDESLAKIVNEDEFLRCYQAISISTIDSTSMTTSEMETVIQTNTSKKSDNVVYIVDTLKDYMNRLNMSLDFTNEKSVADVMVEVSKYIRDNNILATYKENPSLEEFFNHIYDQTHTTGYTLTDGDVITNDGNYYIPESEMNHYGVTSQDDYENKVRQETENNLNNQNTFVDVDGNVKAEGSDAEQYAQDYKNGYTAGSRQGTIDGNALSTCNPNTSGSKGYQDGYSKGYIESYNEAKAYRESYSNDSTTEFTPVENGATTEEVIEQGPISSIVTNGDIISGDDSTLPPVGTVVEEEVIEQGTLNYTLTEDELYQVYYEVLYGNNSTYTEENVKVK